MPVGVEMSNVIEFATLEDRIEAAEQAKNVNIRALRAIRRCIETLRPYSSVTGVSNVLADLIYLEVKVDSTTP